MERKFEPTDLKKIRAEYEALPDRTDDEGKLSRAEYNEAVKKMKKSKATGIDGIPAEVWQNSTVANELLFRFLKKIWAKEEVPPELVVGIFVMIFKKEDPEKCANYICIGLLNHGYKILSVILLHRLLQECKSFFSDWQAGFRKQRGCRDNILILRIIYDQFIRGNSKLIVTFVSHKFIDAALAKAGASRKTRAIFRVIYRAASGVAKASGTQGKFVFSEPFDISRGVVQGDIISPILFILALDKLVKTYDVHDSGAK